MDAMRTLAVWLILLCTPLFSVFAAGMIAAGNRYSPEATQWSELGFTHCALPCWVGLTPGETPFDTTQIAYQIVQAFHDPSTQIILSSSQINFSTTVKNQQIIGLIFYTGGDNEGGVIGDIRLILSLPMWQLIGNLGEPDCVWTEGMMGLQGRRVIGVYWEHGGGISMGALLAVDARGAWHPDTNVESFWVSVTSSACDQPESVPWLGFASFQRYEGYK